MSNFLDKLHTELRELERERGSAQKSEEALGRELKRLEAEGQQEQRQKTREFERKLDSLIRDFEYQIREAVNAVQDRAAAQKLSKQAEQKIAKMRREFKEQFDALWWRIRRAQTAMIPTRVRMRSSMSLRAIRSS